MNVLLGIPQFRLVKGRKWPMNATSGISVFRSKASNPSSAEALQRLAQGIVLHFNTEAHLGSAEPCWCQQVVVPCGKAQAFDHVDGT